MSVRLINARSRHFLFQFSVFLNYQNGRVRSKTRIFGYLVYRGYFSPTSINSIFYFHLYENLDYKKFEIFKHPSFRYSPLDFQTSIFSIFAYSRIRKLGFQKSEIFKHPSQFRYSLIVKYENLDHKNPRFLNVQWNIQFF